MKVFLLKFSEISILFAVEFNAQPPANTRFSENEEKFYIFENFNKKYS